VETAHSKEGSATSTTEDIDMNVEQAGLRVPARRSSPNDEQDPNNGDDEHDETPDSDEGEKDENKFCRTDIYAVSLHIVLVSLIDNL